MRAKNEEEFRLVNKAVEHIGLYKEEFLKNKFYNDIVSEWRANINHRNVDLGVLQDSLDRNKMLRPELIFKKRNEFISSISPILQAELER